MKRRCFLVFAFFVILLSLAACGRGGDATVTDTTWIDDAVTSPVHEHEYFLSKTVEGTCVEDGYELYVCSCGLSYKNLLPSAHKYTTVADTTGKYVKNVCSLCGDYKIVRDQTYLHNLTFENFTDVQTAVNAQKNLKFYAIASADGADGGGEIRVGADGNCLYIHDANFYVQDTSRSMVTKKFVVSFDVKFDKTTEMELLSFVFQKTDGSWNYNSGIVKVASDGHLKIFGRDAKLDVTLKDKGYNNITVVCDPKTTVCDVYVDEKLVAEKIRYVACPSDARACYIRYFDRKKGYSACIDNLKMYVADTPEFVVPNGLVFKK